MLIMFSTYFITFYVYCSDILMAEEELGREVYLRPDQVKVDTVHVDPLMVTAKVEVLSIIRKVS